MKLPDRFVRETAIAVAMLFALMILLIDIRVGPFIRLPILLVLPVAAVSWFGGIFAAEAMAVGLPLLRLMAELPTPKPWHLTDSLINTAILILTLALIAALIHLVNHQQRKIKILQGLLPICSFCKKIRTGEQSWEPMESYFTRHAPVEFTHGLCPE